MRSVPVTAFAAVTTATVLTCAACSSAEQPAEPTSAAPSAEAARATGPGVSAAGVTTRVDAPAAATESQYGQACLAAKRWMDERGGEPTALVEPYLELLQAPDFRDPGNFNAPWATLTPGQQAGVIMAANAAAKGECD